METLLQKALLCHQDGRVEEAKALYHKVLEADPRNVQALHLSALLWLEEGAFPLAEERLRLATEFKPESAGLHLCLGDVLAEQGKVAESIQSYRRAVGVKENFPEAWVSLGDAFMETRGFSDAKASYERVLGMSESPQPSLLMRLGAVHFEMDELGEACQRFQQVLAVDPKIAEAHLNLGNIYRRQGNLLEAEAAFRQALRWQPTSDAYCGLGELLQGQQRMDEALQAYQAALHLDPEDADIHNVVGSLQKRVGDKEEALRSFERSLELKPEGLEARMNHFQTCQEVCDWTDYQQRLSVLMDLTRKALKEGSHCPVSPFLSLSMPFSAEEQLAIARAYASRHGWVDEKTPLHRVQWQAGERLRVGYVSSDFHNHPVAHLICGLFAQHNWEAVEVFVYSFGGEDSSVYRQRVVDGAEHFVDITNESVEETAKRIAKDGIHVLVDLKGFTLNHRPGIFTYRPAPVQMTWLGHPGGMGMDCIDYLIGDPVVTPEGCEDAYAETIVRMPRTYQVNDHLQEIAKHCPSRAEAGLPEDAFVFACFNQNYKFEPRIWALWMDILKAVPGSVLWMLRYSKEVASNLQREAEACGVDSSRLVFGDRVCKSAHLARHRLADLFLDTYQYNAHTTASDALYTGLPMVTCIGDTFASRVAASLLHTVGLPELITHDLTEYRDLAVSLANDPNRLKEIRDRLDPTPLFDTSQFAMDLESLYRRLISSHMA